MMNLKQIFDPGNVFRFCQPVIKALLIFAIGHFITVYLIKLTKKGMTRAKLDPSLIDFLGKVVNITLHIVILLSALNAVGVSTTGLLAALSAAAVGIALALKDSLSNLAGGILLLLSPCFSTGDYIETDGEGGYVTTVNLMHTTILTYDHRQVSIPNGVLINSRIINHFKEETRRLDLTFSISYECDPELAKRVAMEAVLAHPMTLGDPAPFVRVSKYAESSVELLVRAWCISENYWDYNYDLLEQIRKAFNENGIEIPFNQLDVHLK